MPDISEEELKKISEGLTKAVESERRGKAIINALGPALLSALDPIMNTISATVERIPAQIEKAIGKVQINVPKTEVPTPRVTVNIPEIKVPKAEVDVKIPEQPNYTFKVPPIKVPTPKVTVNVPKNSNSDILKGLKSIENAVSVQKPIHIPEHPSYTFKQPIPAIMVDAAGKPMDMGGSKSVSVKKGLHIDLYDYVALSQSDNQDIYTFKRGGSGGKAVAGITILYVDATRSTIVSVTKS